MNYPKWWNNTITVYNRYIDSNQVSYWYRKVLNNCFWKNTNNKVLVGNTFVETNTTIVRIPYNSEYVPLTEWLTLEDKDSKFTLSQGTLIFLGEVDEIIDDYTTNCRSSDLINKYKQNGVFTTENFTNNTNIPPKHYCCKGV